MWMTYCSSDYLKVLISLLKRLTRLTRKSLFMNLCDLPRMDKDFYKVEIENEDIEGYSKSMHC